ncbi:MAG: hypothetical protein IPM54_10840 [Polyangiaceae bacterium]|nr:hypothetical protein [Polyangiaceae bacterium]
MVTTFLPSEHDDGDTMLAMLAASMRLGAEIRIAGPPSLRVDVFALMPLGVAALGAQHSFAAGASAMAVWSFE